MSSDRTLSLKCPCGYIKHDVMHLGNFEQHKGRRLLDYCGGLFLVNANGDGVTCKKCGNRGRSNIIQFHCSFCNRVTNIGVQERIAKLEGRVTTVQMSVHTTAVFSISQ